MNSNPVIDNSHEAEQRRWGWLAGLVGTAGGLFGALAALVTLQSPLAKISAALACFAVTGVLWQGVRDRTRGRLGTAMIVWLVATGALLLVLITTLADQRPLAPAGSAQPLTKNSETPVAGATLEQAGSGTSASPTPSQASSAPASVLLADLHPVRDQMYGSERVWRDQPVTINGTEFTTGFIYAYPRCGHLREYALSARYTRFLTTVGIDDDSRFTEPGVLRILADGKPVKTIKVKLTEPVAVELDVTGVIRLGFDIACQPETAADVALGDPRLTEK
ncbi:NPCBM/NEW2 domain-containing protein [Catellatospora sichuanensis]|uniref:NPCBM/NEW2 domain-containing protein n=1 Tax=Catellatospora sichuanensis TaxID=1969805 RepID=UPI001642E4B3|nr:NPCBM/NEW2 domain-containing protein [Catellatospora sichuanensis]